MKEKWLQLFIIICFTICFVGCAMENITENQQITIPSQETIETVQYNTTKFPAQRLKQETLSSLVQDLEALQPITGEKPKQDDWFQTICFIYEDGTKDVFIFWKEDGKWYARTQKGNVYQNADFLQKYMDIEEKNFGMIIDTEDIIWNPNMQDYGEYDEGYEFAFRLQKAIDAGYSLKQAEEMVRNKAMREEAAYQYAVSLGLKPTKEELQADMAQIIEEIKKLSNYTEIENFCAEIESTPEAEVYKREESIQKKYCIKMLYRKIYDAFRCGEDTLDGQVYDTVADYWDAYLDKVIAEQQIDFSEMDRQLEKAKHFLDIS